MIKTDYLNNNNNNKENKKNYRLFFNYTHSPLYEEKENEKELRSLQKNKIKILFLQK